MEKTLYQLILASQSPRRKELLRYLGVNFEIIPSNSEEKMTKSKVEEIVEELAFEKAIAIQKILPNKKNFIIGADTIVSYQDRILGKPKSVDDAISTLRFLSGNVHNVFSGVCFLFDEQCVKFHEVTKVKFRKLTDEDLSVYLNFDEFSDKAGAYGIQGAAQSFIEKVDGNYSNVVGFPLERMICEFEKLFGKKWRDSFE